MSKAGKLWEINWKIPKFQRLKPVENDEEEDDEDSDEGGDNPNGPGTLNKPGDTIEFDIDGDGQGSLF
ncbi:MAG: hypothetical protein R2784_04635 [Saprospiraceae bacterium]